MKKIFLIFVLVFGLFLSFFCPVFSNGCNFYGTGDVWKALDSCLESSTLVSWKETSVEVWFKKKINKVVNWLGVVLLILSVWSIVYWAILLTLTAWEDEKLKKAKEIIKWWIIGFLCVVSASTVISFIVNVMYWLEK